MTCSDVTTSPAIPNSFLPNPSQYTYDDDNPDPSGVTYNVTFGFTGDLFPPGRTPVTLIAVDIFDNRATCLFFVENPRKCFVVFVCLFVCLFVFTSMRFHREDHGVNPEGIGGYPPPPILLVGGMPVLFPLR